jgi:outer membrane protein assembly factor BamE (lipoprotein component of BamABCDE complex)
MILLFISSCIYVPVPPLDSDAGVINEELINSLEAGETTREDLLLILGAPDNQYDQDRFFIYEWEAVEGVFVGYGVADHIITHYFCVEFDEDNRIKRVAHFQSGFLKTKHNVLAEKHRWIHESDTDTGLLGSGPIDDLPTISDEKRSGEVTVIRISSILYLAISYIINLDGVEIFVIQSGQHTKFKLNEGEHYIGVKCKGGGQGWIEESLKFNVVPNSSSFFKVSPNFFSCAGIESITEEEALIEIKNSKYVPMNNQ